MGIRINTALGYALTDLEEKDPRINWDSKLFDHDYTMNTDSLIEYFNYLDDMKDVDPLTQLELLARREIQEFEEYRETIESLPKLLRKHTRDPYWRFRLDRAVTHYGESEGARRVIMVRPVSAVDWHRYADMIDLWNFLQTHEAYEVRIQQLEDGIFPYSGFYMNADTGEEIPYEVGREWIILYRAFWDAPKNVKGEEILDAYAQEKFGFKDALEADAKIVPAVPGPVKWVSAFGELFTKEDEWKNLRPVLFTYWS